MEEVKAPRGPEDNGTSTALMQMGTDRGQRGHQVRMEERGWKMRSGQGQIGG